MLAGETLQRLSLLLMFDLLVRVSANIVAHRRQIRNRTPAQKQSSPDLSDLLFSHLLTWAICLDKHKVQGRWMANAGNGLP
jgi:hypothetical protein